MSKVAWMRVTRMPSDQTRNHTWHVAHQISLHSQQTDRCKCGGRITVDHVHFECRFVKPLWAIIVAQANGLSVNSFVPQTQQAFLEGTLFQPRFRRKKDAWCDMIHSVVDDHPMTLTSTPSINKTHPLSLSFNPHSTHPGMRPKRDSPHLSLETVWMARCQQVH